MVLVRRYVRTTMYERYKQEATTKQSFEISLNRCGSCYARTVFVSVVVVAVAVGVVLA